MIWQRGPLHPHDQPAVVDWQERYHLNFDAQSAEHLLPTREALARIWGTMPITPLRQLEAEGEHQEALYEYYDLFTKGYVHHNIVETIVACKGVLRNQARLGLDEDTLEGPGPIFVDVESTMPQFNRLIRCMADNFWRTEPPIAIEVKEHAWSLRSEIHEVGPFDGKRNMVLAAIILREAGVSLAP
jgi:hypothetical protein